MQYSENLYYVVGVNKTIDTCQKSYLDTDPGQQMKRVTKYIQDQYMYNNLVSYTQTLNKGLHTW